MATEFFIKQGASQPALVMRVNRDNRFAYEKIQAALENSTITFSMIDIETNILKVAKNRGGLILMDSQNSVEDETEYYVYYKFSTDDTNRPGRYKAEFKIDFFDTVSTDITGTFIAPIHDDLFINVIKSLFTERNNFN